eukprot:2489678-Pyramimonas_sp.AAC.1
MYSLDLPVWDSASQMRTSIKFPMFLPRESSYWSYKAHPEEFDMSGTVSTGLPAHCIDREVTRRIGNKSFPISYCSDGVPHAKKDSFLIFSWANMISGTRHVVANARKSDCCQCGCRGMCTIGPLSP